jgi:hypothetical protein
MGKIGLFEGFGRLAPKTEVSVISDFSSFTTSISDLGGMLVALWDFKKFIVKGLESVFGLLPAISPLIASPSPRICRSPCAVPLHKTYT